MVRVRTIWFSKAQTQARARSPPLNSNLDYSSVKLGSQKSEYSESNDSGLTFSSDSTTGSSDDCSTQSESKGGGNKVMVVVDASQEAKGALQWALSHAVQKEDTVVLLHVAKQLKRESSTDGGIDCKVYGFLYSMKSICEARRPGVQVEVVAVTGKEKGKAIVEQAKKQKVTLLVLGHRRRSIAWRLLMRCVGRNRSCSQSIVDYCIQASDCMTVAVRRKGKRLGGYKITTKRHKNFWLLA